MMEEFNVYKLEFFVFEIIGNGMFWKCNVIVGVVVIIISCLLCVG